KVSTEPEIFPCGSRYVDFHLSFDVGERRTRITKGKALPLRIDIDPRCINGAMQLRVQDDTFLVPNRTYRRELTRLQLLRILLHRGVEANESWAVNIHVNGEYLHGDGTRLLLELKDRIALRDARNIEVNGCHHLEILITTIERDRPGLQHLVKGCAFIVL